MRDHVWRGQFAMFGGLSSEYGFRPGVYFIMLTPICNLFRLSNEVNRFQRVHLDKCPCYTDCYDGCPCDEYESEYCSLSCQELNQDQFISCSDLAQESLFKCLAKCEPFDTDCEHKCSIDFDARLATCPCMDNCPGKLELRKRGLCIQCHNPF